MVFEKDFLELVLIMFRTVFREIIKPNCEWLYVTSLASKQDFAIATKAIKSSLNCLDFMFSESIDALVAVSQIFKLGQWLFKAIIYFEFTR